MIKVENIDVWGFEHAIRGMRNPMNSWDKSDSIWCYANNRDESKCNAMCCDDCVHMFYEIGKNDLDLMRRLYKAGSEHRKYLRQICVSMDITAPLYWWKEFDQYKVGTTTNSTSTMHKLLSKPFEMIDFSFDNLAGYKKEVKCFVPEVEEDMEIWKPTVQDDYYTVSSEGRVSHNGRILSGTVHYDGYIFVNIRGKNYAKHRVVAEAFIPNPENKPFVNHIDGNRQNNKVGNLEWCTQSENIKHAYKNNLQPKGLSTFKGKFSAEQREEIKKMWDSGILSKRQLAKKYGVSHTCINDIITDKYKYAEKVNVYEKVARPLVDTLNELRDAWFSCEDEKGKWTLWYSIIQLLPSSYNQRRTVTMNYENVVNMVHQRTGHKLDEWNEFVEILKDLPYVREITE